MAFRDYSTTPSANALLGDGTYIGPNMLRNKVRPALQQLAADGKDLYDDLSEQIAAIPAGAPGVNGGIGSSAGNAALFAAANGMAIGSGITSFRVAGYSVAGIGGATYVYDEDVDADYIADNPRSSFIAADGRGFRLSTDQIITPYMFGAAASLTDNAPALQAFFDFLNVNNVAADWSGSFEVQDGMVMGGAYGEDLNYSSRTNAITGAIWITVTANIDGPVLTNRMPPYAEIGKCNIGPFTGDLEWSARLFDIGVLFEDKAQLQVWAGGSVTFARVWGLFVQTGHGPTDNTFGNDLGTWFFYGCGSGAKDVANSYQSTAYSALSRTGSAGVLAQSNTLTVTSQPDQIATSADFETPLFALFENEIYSVIGYNDPAGTVVTYPWVKSTFAASGTVRYVYGGGVGIIGSDAGIQRGTFTSNGCAIGCMNAALYASHVNVTAQHCSIGYLIGAGLSAALVGGSGKLYTEDNIVDIQWNASPDAYWHVIESEQALNLNKVRAFQPRNSDNSWSYSYAPDRLAINHQGLWHHKEGSWDGAGAAGVATLGLDRPCGEIIALQSDNPVVNLSANTNNDNAASFVDYMRLFHRRSRIFTVTGTGADNKPTGTLTINCPATHTINGGAAGVSATFNTFTGPIMAVVEVTTAGAWRVSFLAGK